MARKQVYRRRSATSARIHIRREDSDVAMCGLTARGFDAAGRERVLWMLDESSIVEIPGLSEKACRNCARNAAYEASLVG